MFVPRSLHCLLCIGLVCLGVFLALSRCTFLYLNVDDILFNLNKSCMVILRSLGTCSLAGEICATCIVNFYLLQMPCVGLGLVLLIVIESIFVYLGKMGSICLLWIKLC